MPGATAYLGRVERSSFPGGQSLSLMLWNPPKIFNSYRLFEPVALEIFAVQSGQPYPLRRGLPTFGDDMNILSLPHAGGSLNN